MESGEGMEAGQAMTGPGIPGNYSQLQPITGGNEKLADVKSAV